MNHKLQGADYVAFGSFFPSPTKSKSGIVISHMIQEKPDMISVVSAVFEGGITSNVQNLLQKMR